MFALSFLLFGLVIRVTSGANVSSSERESYLQSYLSEEYHGQHYNINVSLLQYTNSGDVDRRREYPYWLPKTNCYGVTLNTGETVILGCTDQNSTSPGCFKILGKNYEDKGTVCAELVNGDCVGVRTPRNATVYLSCSRERKICRRDDYKELYYNANNYDHREWYINRKKRNIYSFISEQIKKFKDGSHSFYNKTVYRWAKSSVCEKSRDYYESNRLRGHGNCWGLLTDEFECIVLGCPDQKPNGCFKIYTPRYAKDGKIVNSAQYETTACIQDVGGECVGLITPSKWGLILSCKNHLQYEMPWRKPEVYLYEAITTTTPPQGLLVAVKYVEPVDMF